MPETRVKGNLERGPVADVYRNSLAHIPTLAGRLVYLAKLRSSDSGKYEHAGLAQVWGDSEADKALRKAHVLVFREWLVLSLQHRMEDLRVYLDGLAGTRTVTLDTWQKLGPYRSLIPITVKVEEKDLFMADMRALLLALMAEVGLAWADPIA
jgi:hypothetical protein